MRNLHGMHKLFIGISKLWGVAESAGMVKYGLAMQAVDCLEHAWIWVHNGSIYKVGIMSDLSESTQSALQNRITSTAHDIAGKFVFNDDFQGFEFSMLVCLGNKEVMPGFVDSHTHIVFAEPRTEEFKLRIQGAGYEAIAAAGGGILNSARKLQGMSFDFLLTEAKKRLHWMVAHGTTTVEIKSGYGLTVESELMMLRVIAALKAEFPGIIRSTFLGAHAFPLEYKGREEDYVQLIIDTMLPAVVQR